MFRNVFLRKTLKLYVSQRFDIDSNMYHHDSSKTISLKSNTTKKNAIYIQKI